MKRWLTLLACLSLNVQAAEVTVTGYGTSVDEALANARTTAVGQVAGTFVTGQSTLDGDAYRSRTNEYNGGRIRKHEILSVDEKNGLFAVRILADVDTDKVNTVIVSNGAEIDAQVADQLDGARDDHEKTRRIVEALDDPAQAFAVEVTKVTYRNRGELTDLVVQGRIVYSPKWYDDVRVMAKTIGRKVDIGSKWREALWGLAALTAAVNPMLPGTLFSIARHATPPPKPSPEHMVCFGKDNGWDIDECYETRHAFTNIRGDGPLRVYGGLMQDDGRLPFGELRVELGEGLFLGVYPGRRVYFSKSATERKFQSPGIVLFRKGAQPFEQVVTLPTRKLTQAGRIEFAGLRGGSL
jgi:hypothetical protein